MRFVGFNSKVRRQIVEYEGKDTVVTLSKCEIKHGDHDGDGLEVQVKNATEVVKSEKKFDLSKERTQKTKLRTYAALLVHMQRFLKHCSN